MKGKLLKEQAAAIFKEQYAETIKSKDIPAISMAWTVFKDGLHRDGQITDSQVFNWMNPVLNKKQR